MINLSWFVARVFKKWIDLSRHVYNAALAEFKKPNPPGKYTVRDELKSVFADRIAECDMPNTSFEYSVFEAKNAVKAFLKAKATRQYWNVRNGEDPNKGEENYALKFRDCKDLTTTISIDGRNMADGIIHARSLRKQIGPFYTGEGSTLSAKKADKKRFLDEVLETSRVAYRSTQICKLTWDRQKGRFTIYMPQTVEKVNKPPKTDNVVAIDPGVRTLATFYSESCAGAAGDAWLPRAFPLIKQSDQLLAKAEKCDRYYLRCKLKKRAAALRLKARNIVKDMHHKTALFFMENFQTILLPEMKTSRMVGTEKLSSSVSSAMMLSSQYKFRQIMIHKAEKYSRNLILCKEYYTSKTCTRCGTIKEDLGPNKVYNCDKCGLCVDRDYNGARNIMLKHLCGEWQLPPPAR